MPLSPRSRRLSDQTIYVAIGLPTPELSHLERDRKPHNWPTSSVGTKPARGSWRGWPTHPTRTSNSVTVTGNRTGFPESCSQEPAQSIRRQEPSVAALAGIIVRSPREQCQTALKKPSRIAANFTRPSRERSHPRNSSQDSHFSQSRFCDRVVIEAVDDQRGNQDDRSSTRR
jgi:hypothetical protein